MSVVSLQQNLCLAIAADLEVYVLAAASACGGDHRNGSVRCCLSPRVPSIAVVAHRRPSLLALLPVA